MRALWIEMEHHQNQCDDDKSRPVRALWIEMHEGVRHVPAVLSRPVRALWIEMLPLRQKRRRRQVEAREGLVD